MAVSAVRVPSTPIRDVSARVSDGCVVLSSRPARYEDGAESRVWEIVTSADDLSSLSDELTSAATTWPELYHLSRARANILRALDLPRSARVLEIGAGCGALTRYLGERCALVDAIEPELNRAAVARVRTQDLENVEVFVGTIDDVPDAAVYDVAVVIGVLEYIGPEPGGETSRRAFLEAVRSRLAPGGIAVIGIENALGVKYLAGSPEDHTARVFDSVEGYPAGGAARACSRAELEQLLEAAGFDVAILNVFPDYKLARVLLSDRLFELRPDLAWRTPVFPSPSWTGDYRSVMDERRLWRTLVKAGLGSSFGNSFLALGIAGGTSTPCWPDSRLAMMFSTDRRSCFAVATEVALEDARIRFRRRRVAGSRAESGRLELRVSSGDLVEGQDLLEELESADPGLLARRLSQWRELVETHGRDGDAISIDLLPHNVIVRDDGRLHPIDLEWWLRDGRGVEAVVERGVFQLAWRMAARGEPRFWPGQTVADIARRLGELVGLDAEGAWLAGCIEKEAEILAEVTVAERGSAEWREAVARMTSSMQRELSSSPDGFPAGARLPERFEAVVAELSRREAEVESLQKEIERLRGVEKELSELRQEVAQQEARLSSLSTALEATAAREAELRSSIGELHRALVRRDEAVEYLQDECVRAYERARTAERAAAQADEEVIACRETAAQLAEERDRAEELARALQEEVHRMERTRVWRLGTLYWRARDRVRSFARRGRG